MSLNFGNGTKPDAVCTSDLQHRYLSIHNISAAYTCVSLVLILDVFVVLEVVFLLFIHAA